MFRNNGKRCRNHIDTEDADFDQQDGNQEVKSRGERRTFEAQRGSRDIIVYLLCRVSLYAFVTAIIDPPLGGCE